MPLVAAIFPLGCSSDLLPGELVVPGELAAVSYEGSPGSALGASVALGEQDLLAGATGSGSALLLQSGAESFGPAGLGAWTWWRDELPFAAVADGGVYRVDGEQAALVFETPGATSFAAGWAADGFRVVSSSSRGVQIFGAEGERLGSLDLSGVQRVALGQERVLALRCDAAGCGAYAWYPADGELELLGQAGDGGGLVEAEGVAWWGDPELDEESGAGRVCSELGDCIEGLLGDHMGRSLCESHAAGVFNTWLQPARIRIVPLQGGSVLAVDRSAPTRPPALHQRDGLLAIGLPGYGTTQRNQGRVLSVELPD